MKKKPFKYERRSEDSFQKQAEGGGGSWARVFKDQFKTFKCKEGDHRIRILPPTFEGAEHYALSMWVHSGVGPDRETFLCLNKMKQEPCPVCEEHRRAQREGGDEKYVYSLRPYERRLAWIINRAAESDGPILYDMPYAKMDKMICAVAKDQETGEVLWIDDPDNGYDIFFNRKGTTQTGTVYSGHAPARRASSISLDEDQQQAWLEYITEHPLDSVLNFYSYEHIQSVFSGSVPRKGKTEEDAEPVARTRAEDPDRKAFVARMDLDDEPAPKRTKAAVEADDDDDDEPAPPRKRAAVVDDDDGDDEPAPPRRAAPKGRAPVDDDDDGDDEPAPAPRKAATKESAPPQRKAPKAAVLDDDDDGDDEPAPPKRRKPVAVVADDDEE